MLKDPPKRAKRNEIEGQAILNLELLTMDTQKKTQKKEVNTKIPKARKQKQPQQRKEEGKTMNL